MSVTETIKQLQQRLATITTPYPLRIIYGDPREQLSLGDIPCAIVGLSPEATHTWGTESAGAGSGQVEHVYTVAIYIMLGARNTPLSELHQRSLPWPEALMRALVADLTLNNTVDHIGDPNSDTLFTYTVGAVQWGDQVFWGLICQLLTVERSVMTVW